MKIGMLWLDDDKRLELGEKVRRAADYYRRKYGSVPDLCLVNSGALAEELQVGSIKVMPAPNVLPNHLWVGMKAS